MPHPPTPPPPDHDPAPWPDHEEYQRSDAWRPACECQGWCGRGHCGAPVVDGHEMVPRVCGAALGRLCVALRYVSPGAMGEIVPFRHVVEHYAHQAETAAYGRALNLGEVLSDAMYERYKADQEIKRMTEEGARDRFVRDVLVSELEAARRHLQACHEHVAACQVLENARRDAVYDQRERDVAAWLAEARVVAPARPRGTFWATCSVPERVDLAWVWMADPGGPAHRRELAWRSVCQWCRRARFYNDTRTGGLGWIESRHADAAF